MPRAALRQAGTRVLARAQRLSDDLLVREEQTFAGYRQTFAASARRVAMILAAMPEPRLVAGQWRPPLEREARTAHRTVAAPTRALLEAAFDLSLDAIADELGHLAAAGTIGRGAVMDAVVEVRAARDAALGVPDLTEASVARLLEGADHQVRLSWSRREARDVLVRRVTAERPNLPGAPVLWPSAAGWLSVRVRAQVIDLANAVRIAVMEEASGDG